MRNVFGHQLREYSTEYAHLINDKDLEQLVATRELGVKHLQGMEEQRTPKQFAKILGLKVRPTSFLAWFDIITLPCFG